MVFKSLNGLVSEYLTSKFIKRNESNYSLRASVNKLVVPFPETNYMKNSYQVFIVAYLLYIMLALGFLGFRVLVIVLEFIVPDEFFAVCK